MSDTTELEKLRKEADEARKARDANWNLYQGATTELQQVRVERDKFSAEAGKLLTLVAEKDTEIAQLKAQETQPVQPVENPTGALALITLALKAAVAGKWS